ncbi:MAG: Cys-Xaa-Xaa-Xaa repeat radical SAM target protein, partial [Bacteroidaceae bacterium]|nr:Cys-Xaa-Xaa-Xaa repeat radical SAM target protein [Bacteroidaceae bacterium]
MKKNEKNEGLQSRRDFFKKAAKGALPILGALMLSSTPTVTKAAETPMGCNFGCTTGCSMGCYTTCRMMCSG